MASQTSCLAPPRTPRNGTNRRCCRATADVAHAEKIEHDCHGERVLCLSSHGSSRPDARVPDSVLTA
eukprot:12902650-Alexandrium_andersonii.AAC.1